jgi:hypothetical protein
LPLNSFSVIVCPPETAAWPTNLGMLVHGDSAGKSTVV